MVRAGGRIFYHVFLSLHLWLYSKQKLFCISHHTQLSDNTPPVKLTCSEKSFFIHWRCAMKVRETSSLSCALNSTGQQLGVWLLRKRSESICADLAKVHHICPISDHFGTALDTQQVSHVSFRGNFLDPQLIPAAPDCLHSQGVSGGHLAFEMGREDSSPGHSLHTVYLRRDFSLLPTCKLCQLQH